MSAPTAAGPIVEQLAEVEPIDRLIFDLEDLFGLEPDERARHLIASIDAAYQRHRFSSPRYDRYCDRLGGPAAVTHLDDLRSVPQLPVGTFKATDVRSGDEPIVKRCTSSGTMGVNSTVFRDEATLERFLGSIRSGTTLFSEWDDDDVCVLNLGPSPEEAGDLWFAYVMGLLEVRFSTEHAVEHGRFDPATAVHAIGRLLDKAPQVGVVGPPHLALEVARAAESAGLRADDRLTVVTGGGWKSRSGSALPREQFDDIVGNAFGLATPAQLRDTFNQVELNTVLFECEHRRKHVPPWLHVFVRDLRTLEPRPDGEVGLLSYLDGSATSYPCFLISDDLGLVASEPCPCGRAGSPTIALERRLERADERGCARKMVESVEVVA